MIMMVKGLKTALTYLDIHVPFLIGKDKHISRINYRVLYTVHRNPKSIREHFFALAVMGVYWFTFSLCVCVSFLWAHKRVLH